MKSPLSRYLTGRGPAQGALNIALVAAIVFLLVWIGYIWTRPLVETVETEAAPVKSVAAQDEPVRPGSDYSILDSKDPFGPPRVKAVATAKPKPVAPPPVVVTAPPPPPPKPIPKFVLVGTALLGSQSTAIITYPGGARDSYKLGEVVEGFQIKQIKSNSVALERDGQEIRIFITESPGQGGH